jgi:hypothetical protein
MGIASTLFTSSLLMFSCLTRGGLVVGWKEAVDKFGFQFRLNSRNGTGQTRDRLVKRWEK